MKKITGVVKKILGFVLLQVLAVTLRAQDFQITRFELAGDKLIISYSLADTVKNRHYTVNVYSSRDNFLNPLQKLSGDAGLEIAPGPLKRIVWNAKEELGAEFSGRVSVEIRGREYVPFVRLTGFEDTKVHKRGVPFTVTWTGGTRQNVLNFDLYQDEKKVWTQAGVGNTGNVDLTIPTNVPPGKDYRFRISDSKNREDVVFTNAFAVKRKIPLLVKAIPIIAVGAGLLLIKPPPPPPGDSKLIDPLCPDGTNDCNQ